jgi:hypothetical protein
MSWLKDNAYVTDGAKLWEGGFRISDWRFRIFCDFGIVVISDFGLEISDFL